MKISLNDVVYNAKVSDNGIVSLCVSDVEKEKLNFKDFKLSIRSPLDCLPLISKLAAKKQECFNVIAINSNNEVIKNKTLFKGGMSMCHIDQKIVFKFLLMNNASGFIVSHNHPSNNVEPSTQDIVLTQELKSGGELLGIKLLDHIIIGKYNFYSFSENRNIL